jgi:hypothetical protein
MPTKLAKESELVFSLREYMENGLACQLNIDPKMQVMVLIFIGRELCILRIEVLHVFRV